MKTLPEILTKFTSRKFLATAAVEVGLLVAMFAPEYGDQVTEVIVRVGTIVGMVAVAIGYVVVEGKIDKERTSLDVFEIEAERLTETLNQGIELGRLEAEKNS